MAVRAAKAEAAKARAEVDATVAAAVAAVKAEAAAELEATKEEAATQLQAANEMAEALKQEATTDSATQANLVPAAAEDEGSVAAHEELVSARNEIASMRATQLQLLKNLQAKDAELAKVTNQLQDLILTHKRQKEGSSSIFGGGKAARKVG